MRKEGKGGPKGLVHTPCPNPEKYPDCRTYLIDGAATQTFAPGGKQPPAATGRVTTCNYSVVVYVFLDILLLNEAKCS